MKFAPGQAVPRTEDNRLLVGKGRFADDVSLPDQAFAAMVRSPHPHADINRIDGAAALELPGVLAVLTGKDWIEDGMGGLKYPGHMRPKPLKRPSGEDFNNPDRQALPDKRVRFLGEAVAVVVANSPAIAADAAELVEVDYDPLPANADTAAANAANTPLVWDDFPKNEIFIYSEGDGEATQAAINAAPHVLKQRLIINRIQANPMEPRSFNGHYDWERDHYTIYGGVHRSFSTRDMFAEHVFHVRKDQIDVIPGDQGGSFGLRGGVPVEMAIVGWASKKVGRPVKWTTTRSEMLTSDDQARDVITDAEIAFDESGRILALRARNINNIGAYMSYFGAAPATNNIGSMAGTYTIPAMHVEVCGVWTNTCPISPYRGSGRPEAAYVTERMIDLAAAKLGMDPVEMRRINLIPNDAYPYKTALTFTYDCGEFDKVMEKALKAADYHGFPSRRTESESRGKLRGIGVAMGIEIATAPGVEYAGLKFAADGTVTVLAGTTNHGQGHETIYNQYIVDRLGIDPSMITVIESDTRVMAAGNGTGGSRSGAYASGAIINGIEKCVEKGRRIAAHLLQTPQEQVTFRAGEYRVRGSTQKVSFAEVARAAFNPDTLPEGMEPGMHETGIIRIEQPNFPNGCHVCEVEIDPEFGSVDIIAHAVCDDVGFELNPLIVQGQLQGGVLQGAGQALMENIVYDGEAQNLSGSFMDYAVPRATDYCTITTESHPVPTSTNPTGVKGVGESGTVGSLPALINAICNALAPVSVQHIDMPATPQKIWRSIKEARAGG